MTAAYTFRTPLIRRLSNLVRIIASYRDGILTRHFQLLSNTKAQASAKANGNRHMMMILRPMRRFPVSTPFATRLASQCRESISHRAEEAENTRGEEDC